MTEVGSIEIGGSVNTENIESGLSRVESGLKNVGAAGSSVGADFERISQNAQRLSTSLKIMAIAGVTSIVGIAKGAPAVAGAISNMRVSFGKLSRELGVALQPAFQMVSEAFSSFVGWVSDNKETINDFATNTIGGLVSLTKELYGIWTDFSSTNIPFIDIEVGEGIKYMVNNFGAEGIAALIGGKFLGPVGAIGAAGITAISRSDPETTWSTPLAATGGALGIAFGPMGIVAGAGAGALIGRGIDLYLNRQDRKSTSLDLEYAT